MKRIDIRLKSEEISALTSLVGRTLESIQHDPFTFVNASSQVVQLNSDIGSFYLYSFSEPLDYFGTVEDVATWSFESERHKFVERKSFISTPIQEVVKDISLVQENQRLYKGQEQIYDVWLTRGIIIDFGDHQLAFEKAVWFSEDIYIRKGYNVVNQFASVDSFVNNDWDSGLNAACSRKIESLAQA